ncbi:hypothetical protein [Novipirellula rosea]|uniref:hypothetical protein n=1 Tax=Novipirellula rosea TaxID=1031540 RepID=UPI0031EDD54A
MRSRLITGKPAKHWVSAGFGSMLFLPLARPVGVEQSPQTRGNTQTDDSAVSPAVSSVHGGDERAEKLMRLWESLDDAGKDGLLTLAKGLAGRSVRLATDDILKK